MSKTLLKFNDGCTCTQPAIIPKNWKTDWKEQLLKDWKLQYYFFDPAFKDDQFDYIGSP
ncbi:hypothetical protein N9789_00435 [bacterium]|nr:hypothetical protein [Polaribacter sp.]MDB4216626.1 hypothetical protein [bacterium]